MSEIKLYDFQEKIVQSSMEILEKKNKCLIVVPTGGGKTVIFSEICKRLNVKTLIVAHTSELIQQAIKTSKMIGVKKSLLYIESIQKLTHRCNKLNPNDDYKLIIIDECHRIMAPSYEKLIMTYPNAMILGVTATPYRSDGKIITSVLGYPEELLSMIDLIKSGFLCDLIGHRIKTSVSLQKIARTPSTKDFSSGSLAAVVNCKERNEIIFNQWKKICEAEKTLGFGANVSHCKELAKYFKDRGVNSEAITGTINPDARQRMLNDFKNGAIRVLWNCQVLTEGFDEPSIECILMARPTLSKRLYIQMVGRGSRIFENKKQCRIIEFTDNDYDVCDLRDLLKLPKNAPYLSEGEKITRYHDNIGPELFESTGEIVSEQWHVLTKHFDPPASSYVISLLDTYKISYSKNVTDFQANVLLNEYLTSRK